MVNNVNIQPGPVIRILALSTLALTIIMFSMVSRPAFALEILIGSSRTTTFNYHFGRALCRLISRGPGDLDCDVSAADVGLHSADYVHTLTNVRNGALDLGIIDSSVQYDAINKTGRFEYYDGDFKNIRGLFSVNGVPFTIVLRGNENLASFNDLEGKKVNVGNPGSPQRAIMDSLLEAQGWSKKSFQLAEELPATNNQDTMSLCFGAVDAVVRFNVQPDAATRHMVDLCDARLLPITGDMVDKLISKYPYYSTQSIAAGTYASNAESVATFGLLETVVTSEEVDADTVYALVKSVFDQIDRLRNTHPVFSSLNPVDMISKGMTAPLHEGALKYYREQGWMQ
jgi:hypothetical protein